MVGMVITPRKLAFSGDSLTHAVPVGGPLQGHVGVDPRRQQDELLKEKAFLFIYIYFSR